MTLSTTSKEAVNSIIFERAYEIENMLSENNYFNASLCGVKPMEVSVVALEMAIKELKTTFSE